MTYAVAVLSLRSLGFNINTPAMWALRADITPPEARGRYFGLFMTAFTAGDVISPLISTYLYDVYRFSTFQLAGITVGGFSILFFINAILTATAMTLLLTLIKEPTTIVRRQTPPRHKRGL